MPSDRRLYRCGISLPATRSGDGSASLNVQRFSPLSDGAASSTAISSDPSGHSIITQYRGYNAMKLAREIIELSSNEKLSPLPYYGVSSTGRERSEDDGYYTLENADFSRNDMRVEEHLEVSLSLREVGTVRNQWSRLKVKQTQPRNDFGNDTTAYVGIPTEASKVRWWDSTTGSREQPSLVATRGAEFGDVDIYDYRASSLTEPSMIYELQYERSGRVDPGVWDTRGKGAKIQTVDGENVVEWQRVFDPAHEDKGQFVLDNGLIRVYFDDENQSMSAESWDDGNGTWNGVSLGASDWALYDTDVYYIGKSRVDARVSFENTVNGSFFELDASLKRGYLNVQWTVPDPDNQGTTPNGLVDKLSPIANGGYYDPNATVSTVDKTEVRR
jgi:hypothetical protein